MIIDRLPDEPTGEDPGPLPDPPPVVVPPITAPTGDADDPGDVLGVTAVLPAAAAVGLAVAPASGAVVG
jgi:hypothetical protein